MKFIGEDMKGNESGIDNKIIVDELQDGELIDTNEDFHDYSDNKLKHHNYKKTKNGKIQIWVKKETLEYEEELALLQIELLKLQNHTKETGEKILMIFEGRDAAGKGGTIKRITEHLNPRGARIVALEKPSDTQKTQWYFQRYTAYLPSAGEIVFLIEAGITVLELSQ